MTTSARGARSHAEPSTALTNGGADASLSAIGGSSAQMREIFARAAWCTGENWEPSVRTPASVEAINIAIRRLAEAVQTSMGGSTPDLEGLPATLPWRRLHEALHSG